MTEEELQALWKIAMSLGEVDDAAKEAIDAITRHMIAAAFADWYVNRSYPMPRHDARYDCCIYNN